ncbi:diguanylate cyclase domain-containing protein [Afifella sp. IM 167]|uniref:bifunctional diguanylate cyclase/phosphodiesterase n=1 Tax=Afifella sp. IM 167 TaxID=2033586 RepID=UPI001CCD8FE3|nr:hypothetical protein [Afifella sp. IM 167]
MDPASAYVPDLTPVMNADADDDRPAPGATAQAILTEIGETVYEWDLVSDRLRWASNAARALGIPELKDISTGKRFDALVDPDSLMNRTQAVRNAIAIDYGQGVPYDLTYALNCDDASGHHRIWVRDRGRWYAGHSGEPVLARGAVRVQPRQDSEAAPEPASRTLKDRADLLRLLEDTLVVSRHYQVPFVFALVSIDNLKLATETYGPQVIDPILNAIALALSRTVRETDLIGKLAEGEIAIVLNRVEPGEAEAALQRLAESLKGASVPLRDRVLLPVTSVGAVSLKGGEAESLRQCLDAARRALSRAQEAGGGHLALDRGGIALPPITAPSTSDEVEELLEALREGRFLLSQEPARHPESTEPAFYRLAPTIMTEAGGMKPADEPIARAEGLGFSQLVDMRLLYLARERLAATPGRRFWLSVSTGALGNEVWMANLARVMGEEEANAGRLILAFPFAALVAQGERIGALLAEAAGHGCGLAVSSFDGRFWSASGLKSLGVEHVGMDFAGLRLAHHEAEDAAWRASAEFFSALGLESFVSGVPGASEAERLARAGFSLISHAPDRG